MNPMLWKEIFSEEGISTKEGLKLVALEDALKVFLSILSS
jgi:hypothetical protein